MLEPRSLFTRTETRNSNSTERSLVNHEKRIREEAQKQRAKELQENMLATPSRPLAELMEKTIDARTRNTQESDTSNAIKGFEVQSLATKIQLNLRLFMT